MKVDSYRLRFGHYETPPVEVGQRVKCAVRGEVVVVGLSNGRIPWPIAYKPGNANRMLVVYSGLTLAVKREASIAVCHWWGVTPQTISRWRKVMSVGPNTVGSAALRRGHGLRNWLKVKSRLLSKAQDPQRADKIAAARHGKPRPAHVMEPARQANIGRKPSRTARANMSAAQRARGARPPWLNPAWSAEDDALLKTLPAAEVAKRTGRTMGAVYARRSQLKLPDGRRRKE